MTDIMTAKATLRSQLLTARRERTPAALTEAGHAIAAHAAAQPAVTTARSLACYLSMRGEPPTGPLLTQRRSAGTEIVVPLTRTDGALDWVDYDPLTPTSRSSLGVDEPIAQARPGKPLLSVGLIIVPALAVDHSGHRLGRGKGYYDRALSELPTGPARPLVCAVVFADEIVADLPHETHDVPVDLVLSEAGFFRPKR